MELMSHYFGIPTTFSRGRLRGQQVIKQVIKQVMVAETPRA
jgi:hypothetical protein